jgi:tRNA (guanine-N7-)-methyltransferase
MGKNKLQRYKDIRDLENVFEYTDFQQDGSEKPKGKWAEIFGNKNPLILELACGKGEYTLSLARRYPDKNFIGIDIKGARIWVGANHARDESLQNVHFIRMFIDHIEEYFDHREIDEIWIPFPDPYLREKKENKRLTSNRFLERYRTFLKPGGIVHLKTDSDPLFRYTLNVIQSENCNIHRLVRDVYGEAPDDPLLSIQTFYEKHHLSNKKTIKYVSFSL